MVKTLEQCITDTYLESPWAKVSHISDVEDSDVEMHPPQGKEDQGDWVFKEADEEAGQEAGEGEEADPSFEPLSPSAEPLDWGSDLDDGKVCVCPSSLLCLVHTLTELHQPLKRLRCMAGTSKGALRLTSENTLGMLPKACFKLDRSNGRDCRHSCALNSSVNLGDSKCEHGQLYIFCGRCKEHWTKPTWLLDSGASSHFCFDLNDFIEYWKYKPHERTPVTTAAHTIYVEGEGTVLLKHLVNGKTVRTHLEHVLHVPQITTMLLSMGQFLLQGMCISGDALSISLLNKSTNIITCKPLYNGSTIFILEATPVQLDKSMLVIYKADYELMHKRLGHPSKDVLTNAPKHVKGFPKDIEVPSNSPVCPGCAQGKMPASAHPPRATAPFEHIHSDLKSFPVVSYHKYKYFINFIDDYTSYAWVVLLREKLAAITALKQFMVLVKTQYGADIKEWMSDAKGEYKSDAFLKTLKDVGIKILQSAPHTPQQNGRAEHFMCTIMDKAQSM